MTAAKILLFILGISAGETTTIMPAVEQYASVKECADAGDAVSFSHYKTVVVACIDSATGQVAYLRMKR